MSDTTTTNTTISTTTITTLEKRLIECNNKVNELFKRSNITTINDDSTNALQSDEVIRCKYSLLKQQCYVYKFYHVPSYYYDLTLLQRRDLLGASDINQLCKSIIFENTYCTHNNVNDPSDSRYYAVIVQYASRFDTELLKDVIHVLRKPNDRIPRSKFHFKLATEEDSYRISGFKHNAISPYGMMIDIPFVICERILETSPICFYLGGGRVDVKLCLPTKDFIRSKKPIIGRISKLDVDAED